MLRQIRGIEFFGGDPEEKYEELNQCRIRGTFS